MSAKITMEILLLLSDSVQKKVRDVFERLRPKFRDIEFNVLDSADSHPGTDIASFAISNYSSVVQIEKHWAKDHHDDPLPHFILIAEEYRPNQVLTLYRDRYPLKAFFLERSILGDAEEEGLLAGAIKDLIREVLIEKYGEDCEFNVKHLGWKIRTDTEDFSERRFVSFLVDRGMQNFMSRLSFYLERTDFAALERERTETNFWEVFYKLKDTRQKPGVHAYLEKALGKFLERDKPATLRAHHILLQGETGTGKTLVAKWIKDQRPEKIPFEEVSTANLSNELIDIELFGTLEGAWTDAVDRPGRLLTARGGIVFLDEIGTMSLDAQAKLLHYLDNFLVRPQGWPLEKELFSPALVVAATNMDLEECSRRGTFRHDLYRRFKFRLEIPPLRERKSDFRLLVDFVLQDPSINRGTKGHREVNAISVSALKKLELYSFPGNFRELEDCLAKAIFNAVQHRRDTILREDIEL